MSELLVLQRKLQRTASTITKLERQLADAPSSFVLSIRLQSIVKHHEKLQADFYALADKKSLDVCTYRLFGQADDGLSLRGFTAALYEFQASFSSLYDALKSGPRKRTKLGADVVSATRFGFGYAYTGSVGVVLTIQRERMLLDLGPLTDTITTFFSLAEAPTRTDIREIGQRLGPAPLRSIFKWADAHVSDGIGADILWRHGEEARRLVLEHSRMRTLRDEIGATSDEKHEELTVTGVLVGADVVSKQFHLVPDQGDSIKGRFTDAIGADGVRIPNTRYRARLEKITTIHYSSDEEKATWRLLQLEELLE